MTLLVELQSVKAEGVALNVNFYVYFRANIKSVHISNSEALIEGLVVEW